MLESLSRQGFITPDQFQEALAFGEKTGLFLYRILTSGSIDNRRIVDWISKQEGLPSIELERYPFQSSILNLLPRQWLIENSVIPLQTREDTVILAIFDPAQIPALQKSEPLFRKKFEFVLAPYASIRAVLHEFFSGTDFARTDSGQKTSPSPDELTTIKNDSVVMQSTSDRIVVGRISPQHSYDEIVKELLANTIRGKFRSLVIDEASDTPLLHISQDGVFKPLTIPEKFSARSLISHFRGLAGTDVATDLQLDQGRFLFLVDQTPYQAICTFLPSWGREVLKLDIESRTLPTADWFHSTVSEPGRNAILDSLTNSAYPFIWIIGPSGSGKKAIAYSLLRTLAKQGTSSLAVELQLKFQTFPNLALQCTWESARRFVELPNNLTAVYLEGIQAESLFYQILFQSPETIRTRILSIPAISMQTALDQWVQRFGSFQELATLDPLWIVRAPSTSKDCFKVITFSSEIRAKLLSLTATDWMKEKADLLREFNSMAI